jgi:hypothetical protein
MGLVNMLIKLGVRLLVRSAEYKLVDHPGLCYKLILERRLIIRLISLFLHGETFL